MKEIALATFSVLSSVIIIVLLVAVGWYIVWKLFLSRFKFVRELLGGLSNPSVTDLSDIRTKARKSRRD